MTTSISTAAGVVYGELCRDAAIALLRDRRTVLVRRVQRAFLDYLLTHGPATVDPVRALVPIPRAVDPRLVGAAVRALSVEGLVYRHGSERSTRSEAHARRLDVWAIAEPATALAWLTVNPELPDPEPVQRTLWP